MIKIAMNFQKIFHLAWATFKSNRDKSALFLEATTIFCLSLCVGIILGLNAIFNDLIEQSQSIIELNSPVVAPEIKTPNDLYKLHEGLVSVSQELNFSHPGIKLIPSTRNLVFDKKLGPIVVVPTTEQAICYHKEELTKFTIYDITSGPSIMGLPLKNATFKCEWQKSNFSLIKVPIKYWKHVFNDKKFTYSVVFSNFDDPAKNLHEFQKKLKDSNYVLLNADYQSLDYLRISFLQKRIFTTVFSLLCILLFALMMMNCSIFIKNRKNDWRLFYIFKVPRHKTNFLVIIRFSILFFITFILSLLWAVIIANISTSIVQHYLISDHKNFNLSYVFTISDIITTHSLVLLIFAVCSGFAIKGLNNKFALTSKSFDGLEIKNLSVSYPTISQGIVPILKNVNLNIKANTLNAIVGISGSGKTTLLNCIFNNQYLDKQIFIDIQKTAYIPQEAHLIAELTVEENLLLFSQGSEQDLLQLAKTFGIEKILDHYCREISGGEKQRACLVRALLSGAKNLVLDEPTASLDEENKIKCIRLIQQMIQEKRLSWALVVTHDKEVVQNCENIFVLRSGVLNIQE